MSRPGEPRLVFDRLCEAGWPHSIVEVAREGFRRTGGMLCPLVALLSGERREPSQVQSDDLPPEAMIGGVPGWAMDVHTRQGKAVFRVESGLVANRLRWPLADELRRQGDVECSYPDSSDDTEVLELTRADLPILDEVRVKIA